MNILLIWGFLLCMPILLGQGVLSLTDAITHRKTDLATRYVTGVILLVLSAGPVNAYSALRDLPLSKMIWIWGVLLLSFATLCYLATVVQKIMTFRTGSQTEPSGRVLRTIPLAAALPLTVTFLMILGQFLYVLLSGHINLSGDITPETVTSILQTGSLYQINPLTGSPYTVGVPNRLRFMALPAFYAMLCEVFHLPMDTVVCHIIPAYFLLCGYVAYHVLSRALFPGEEASAFLRRALFLCFIAFLVFATDSGLGLDGFDLLHAGYRETTLRIWILIPALIAFVFQRRWVLTLLVLAAEAMTLWTLAGTGAGAVVAVGLMVCEKLLASRGRKEVAA